MKISLFFLFVYTFQLMAVNAEAQNAIIKVPSKSLSIGQLITEIERQTDYLVVYSNHEIDVDRTVVMQKISGKVSSFLDAAFAKTGINYQFKNDYIMLSVDKADKNKVQQQAQKITGMVNDENGEPVIGANVSVIGQSIGTITDINGRFTINAPQGSSIQVSFIGFKSQIITVNKSHLNIKLIDDTMTLNEVVVVGYGTSTKKDLTGAVGIVTGELIENRQSVQISNALQGAVAGLSVTRSSGAPGSGGTIRVRGNTTIGNNDALIIVDGIPTDDINNINPNDIENISVLKDAAASSIYGSRAAAGVILVTTKRAKSGQATFNYNYEFGIEKPTEMPEYVDVVRYMQLVDERQMNDGGSAIYGTDFINSYWNNHLLDPDTYPATDWQDVIYKKQAPRHRHEFTMTMGTDKVKTKASLGYVDIDGLYANSGYKRYMFRVNNDIRLHKMLSANLDVSFKRSNNKSPADSYISSRSVAYWLA